MIITIKYNVCHINTMYNVCNIELLLHTFEVRIMSDFLRRSREKCGQYAPIGWEVTVLLIEGNAPYSLLYLSLKMFKLMMTVL